MSQQLSHNEVRDIVLAEYQYWRAVTEPDVEWFAAGCMAACSNILAAMGGHRAPWHPPADFPGFKDALDRINEELLAEKLREKQ